MRLDIFFERIKKKEEQDAKEGKHMGTEINIGFYSFFQQPDNSNYGCKRTENQ